MYCANCGKNVPDDAKFCPECGGSVSEAPVAETSVAQKKKRKIRWPLLIAGLVILFGALTFGLITYFRAPSNIEVYIHPTAELAFAYPKNLLVETPALPVEAECTAEPCFIVLKDPAYNNETVNWIFVIPVALMGGDKVKLQADLDEDVSKGLATTLTSGDIKMTKYVNDPDNPSEEATGIYTMMGLDPSRERSIYEFLSGDSAIMVGFRTPPPGAPADYDDFLDIDSWLDTSATK